MKPFEHEKLDLPAFPRTAHLPYQVNATVDDHVAHAVVRRLHLLLKEEAKEVVGSALQATI